jgi:hypothetical protein
MMGLVPMREDAFGYRLAGGLHGMLGHRRAPRKMACSGALGMRSSRQRHDLATNG